MKNSFAKKIISIVLASSMLASTPGNIIAQEDLTLLAQESTESGVFSAASSDTEFMDPATDGSMEAPAGMEDTAGSGSSSEDVFDSGETGGTDTSSAAAETPTAEAPAVAETPSAPADTSSAAVPSSDTVQAQPAAAGTDPEVSAAAPAGTDSGAFASLPGMEDEIAVDSDPSEGFVEENLAERTLDVQVYPQRLYEQQDVPTQELKTANELWQWLFGRDPEPNRNPSQNALHVQIQGYLPEDVTASAGYILFDEEKNLPEGESYQETALASIDVTLTRADGSEYLPEAPLDIIISGQPIGHAISRANSYFLVYAHDEYNAMESLIVDESEFTSDVTVFRGLPDNAQEAQNEYWTRVAGLLSYQTALDHERVTFTEDPEGLRTNRSKKRIRFTLNEGQHLRFIVSALDTKEEAPEESGLPDGTAGLFETEAQSEAIQILDTEAQTEAAQVIETETEAAQAVETEIQTEAAQAVETEIQTEAAQAVETEIQTESAQTIETETQTEAASEAETAAQTEAAVEPETAAETEAAPETEAPVVVPESETETEVSAAETETESEAFLETEVETETEEAQSETEAETELTEEELLNRSLRVRTQDGALVSVSGLMPADVFAQVLSEDADIYSEDLEGQGVLALDISLNRETGEVNAPEAGAEAVKNEDSADAQIAGADAAAADSADAGSTGDSDLSAQVEGESSSTVEADNSIAYQPQEPVRVIITDSSIGEAARENAELEVWHIADDGTSTKVENVRFVGNSAIFYADGFSVYVITYTVDFHWGDYTYNLEGEGEITLSALLERLGVTEITLADVADVSFTDPAYIEIEQTDSDWLLRSLAPFSTEEALVLTLTNGETVEIKVTDAVTLPVNGTWDNGSNGSGITLSVDKPHNVKVSVTSGDYDTESGTISYTAVVEAESDLDFGENAYPVVITDLTAGDSPALQFVSGSYTYAHRDGFMLPDGADPSTVNDTEAEATEAAFDSFPLTVAHMYAGDIITLTYTAKVLRGDYTGSGQAAVQNTVTISNSGNPSNDPDDDSASVTTEGISYTPLTREYVTLNGSWAYWEVTVNPNGYTLNGGSALTLEDTFDDKAAEDAEQSIDYTSIAISGSGVTYDYSGSTGTFVIPDNTPVTITYRTRVTAQPGEAVTFRGTAVLKDTEGNTIASTTAGAVTKAVVIYPSASDVTGSDYMVRLYVYGENAMQQGIAGATFILLDANQRPLEYKAGANKGQPVTFMTGSDGYVNIELPEDGGVSIEKNTGYYLEMKQAVAGYQKDNTLYSFLITDDPTYSSGGFYKYFNGDTIKVRLRLSSAGLSVSIRFSGSYALREDQKNNVTAVLQMLDKNNNWVEVERHPYTDAESGTIRFDEVLYNAELAGQNIYRVVEENESPWDLPEDISLTTRYYCLVNAGESDPHTEPQEFWADNPDDSVSVVIDNRYEEPQLTIVKMDKHTGEDLPGAVFSVYKIVNGAESGEAVTTYTTDENGEIVIRGGESFESETLYGFKETAAPEHYLLPLKEEWHYFYFCNDEYLEQSILANLPEDATAINLTNSGDRITVDNQKETVTIPVMKLWQGNDWPEDTNVLIGLYQSVADSDPERVLQDGTPRQVTLTSAMPYNNTAFSNLPSRDGQGRNIVYSIKEESINGIDPLVAGYVPEYGISSSGVYIVRNKPAATLTVSKEWYDWADSRVTDPGVLSEQSSVTFDVYRSSTPFVDSTPDDGITNDDMTAFVGTLTRVRENLSFGASDGWQLSINDLDKQNDLGDPYYYYVLETVPSFGNELYEVDEGAGTVTIKNKIAPQIVNLTVTKAELVGDPRTESLERDFTFTLKLKVDDTHPVRNWTVYTDTEDASNNLVTDWNGEVSFTLKPMKSITLSLPAGVHASVTEAYNPEYTVETVSTGTGNNTGTDDNGRTFWYDVTAETPNAQLIYTNTLHVICKVVDNNGMPTPFESLKRALAFIRDNSASFTSPWTIYMLEDYTIPSTDGIELAEGESLKLTTASTADALFPFNGGEETDRAVITRGGAGGSMLKNAGTLTLENVCLDGGNIAATGDGGLVNSIGTLNLNDKATLRNSAADGKGGAVCAEGTVNIADGAEITGSSAPSASALYMKGMLNMTGGEIRGNTGASDGAVVVESTGDLVNLSGNAVIIGNTNTQGKAANLFIGVDSDSIVNVVNPGLAADAQIGVTAMEGHMLIGEQFATAEFGQTDNLNRFINDVYGYRGKLKDGTSTNVVWDGLTVTIKKVVHPVGANPNDRFTITLSSNSIVMSTYIINGTLDYTVMAARQNRPGRITLRNVKADDVITISPLPVGEYTIAEAESNYTPGYTLVETGSTDTPAPIEGGAFNADNDSTVTVTNTRKLAQVDLTKTLDDRLAGDAAVPFNFTVKLTDADGTAFADFTLAEGVTTDANGTAAFTMSPTDAVDAIRNFKAPVGAAMTVTETVDPNYRIKASAETMPTEGEGTAITDADTDSDNVFAFTVTEDGANVTFDNVRKMAEIELSKTLVGKVSKTEAFTFTLTLTNGAAPVANYIVYRDETNPENNITTDANGVASIPFTFVENETEAKSIPLTIPEGTKLVVAETEVKKNVNGTEQPIYNTSYSVNGGAAATGTTATIAAVSDSDKSIAFTNTRKMQTITVKNTVNGYSGNVVPFSYTATVTDGGENQDDYDLNGFTDGEMTFELTTGQQNVLTVPYGATLTVTEDFIVGYETKINNTTQTPDPLKYQITVAADATIAYNNSQLIGLQLVNNTSSKLENVTITVGEGKKIYRVHDDKQGQTELGTKTATLDIESGATAILEIQHTTSVTAEQNYTVNGTAPADGYYYTINNEPSFHEFADPAILRVYNTDSYVVKGKLRYSVNDSTVTFTEQPLVSFDSNGGSWTTEMDGYHDPDGNRKVYQKAVNSGETVARPTPDPVYPTAEGIAFLGWTTDETFAKQAHTESEDISAKLYDFENTPVTTPFTLYAIWARDPNVRTVTVKNGLDTTLTVTVTLTNDDPSGANYTLYVDTVDSSNNITTDASGAATFTLAANETRNLHVPDGAKLVISGSDGIAYSSDYTDTDSVPTSFIIDSVQNDGTVSFIGGIFKITDAAGNLLYDANGRPAVYGNLRKTNNADPDEAFDAYEKTLYSDVAHTTPATPAAVKQLVDEYTIPNTASIAFPNMTMTLTTAGKDDADFPYVGVRDRATIYRSTAGANANCFTLASGNITLTDIILDGGSEQGVKIAKTTNGGLIYMNNASGVLNVETGTTMRNCEFAAYDDGNNSRGGAIYANNGAINVSAGLFSNLYARHGGAICAEGQAVLSVTGQNGSTVFEDCSTSASDGTNNAGDGGAIYYNNKNASKHLIINGGTPDPNDPDAFIPGIYFTRCWAGSNWGDGGAIYANTNKVNDVTVTGCSFTECSARNTTGKNDDGFGGGGIGVQDILHLTVSHCSFTSCDSLKGGAGVLARVKNNTEDNSTVSISNCSFLNCSCKAQGGGVAAYTDNNGATGSKTKLSIVNCSFKNCSSGTDNGSGGAIQCYLPCMEFTNSTFTDCWAGKEGGAVNNYFGSSYTAVWENSFLKLTNCRFIRCRAEDRYDPTALQHYGGGINTKVKIVTVTDSYFEDCVSTLKEGGALHIGGQGGGSKATITGSTFKNCTAKNGGGAVLSSHETLIIENSYFYGCESSSSNGGAVYHYQNSRGASTQKNLTIKNSTFGVDPNDANSLGCSANGNGGAIWTRATTDVTLENLTIQNAAAGANGGGVYLDAAVTKATLTGGSIKNCQAVSGSAVYVGKAATFTGDLEVSGNTVSDVNSGAIQTVNTGKLYFEGNVKVENNTCSADSTNKHDVLMQKNGVDIIYTTANGLGSEAHIGVYVPDQYFNNRGLEGQPFGTYGSSNYLDAFFNDRDSELYGCQMSASDTKIYWGNYVCKITDADGNTLTRPNGRYAVYQSLSQALDEFTSVKDDNEETGKAVYIKMLIEDYTIRQTDAISNFPAADITLTTASKSDTKHPYRGTAGTVCTISRTSGKEQLFKLNTADATFRLENITLDGRNDKTTDTGNRRLIEAAQGALVINGGTTLQYGVASNGGAIDAAAAAQVTVNGVYDSASKEPTVKFINCTGTGTNKPNGGAIRAYDLNIYNRSENTGEFGTAFINCSAYNGGAITSLGTSMTINGAFFDSCQTQSAGGAIYHNNWEANTSTTIKNCAFENCLTNGNNWAHGGAIEARTAELSVEDCSFKNCSVTSDGGAVYHGYVDGNNKPSGNREKTSIKNTTFDGCSTTGSYTSYSFGGSVYTQAKTIEVIDSSFKDSTSANHGGALYCQSSVEGSAAAISGTSFDNCSTSRSDGSGGAIYSNTKALTLQKNGKAETTINACKAPGYSGAVHMETSGSVLNIKDSTVISACYADKGGAIYLPAGVTMNLTGSPEFSQNGYTTQNGSVVNASEGACIYLAEGSRINLKDSPKFSRNILPTLDRITNGGILDYVRQDVYLAGYESSDHNAPNAASIYVVGELTGDTIWVLPEKDPHRLPNKQFAKIAAGVTVSEDTLSHFRNALADTVTGCSHGEYLAGVQVGSDTENVYWDKMYVVSFMKKDNKGIAVPGAEFTLYSDSACTNPVATATSADGENDTDTHGTLLIRGTVEFTSIRIGAYYMKETVVPTSFKENNTIYLVLVGSPYLERSTISEDLWKGNGPLNVTDAETLVPRHTTDVNKYYGIFPLDANGKAVLRANLASSNVGIENIRNDYEVSFMKVDSSGDALPGAAFTIYSAVLDDSGQPETFADGYPKLMLWSRDGENYPAPAVSADDTAAYKDKDNKTLPKGMVYIRELPLGTYYLLETAYPERNGRNRRAYYYESDRVFKLEISESEDSSKDVNIKLSEWKANPEGEGTFEELTKDQNGYYVVSNQEVVCKLTDSNNNLLYVKGREIWENKESEGTARVFPAVYSTLEEGFSAAQSGNFVDAKGDPVDVTALKLQVLKDFTISAPITYSSNRALTFTTAAKTATSSDRYIFSTTRTSDTARAEIKRAYSEAEGSGALITVANGASLTLQNIKLDGQKSSHTGRAVHVTEKGSLSILNNVQLQNFKQEKAETYIVTETDPDNPDNPAVTETTSVRGGTVLMESGTSITINGGYNRSVVFSNNEAGNDSDSAAGGALALSKECIVNIQNVQFTGNKVTASKEGESANGGAIGVSGIRLDLTNAVFRSNQAVGGTAANGGAVSLEEGASLRCTGGSFSNNEASVAAEGAAANGGAVYAPAGTAIEVNGGITISSNKATNGGGIYNGGTLSIDDARMTGNIAASGAGIYNSGTVRISESVIAKNTASQYGGGVFNDGSSAAITMQSGLIAENTAESQAGSAVYVNGGSFTMTGGTIGAGTLKGTTYGVNKSNYGAVSVNADDGIESSLHFSGDVIVTGNTNLAGKEVMNVYLPKDSNKVINTSGLGDDANIGVYVAGIRVDNSYENDRNGDPYRLHGTYGAPFATKGEDNSNLNKFVNDRNGLVGLVGSDASLVYWGNIIARVSSDRGATWTYFGALEDITRTIEGVEEVTIKGAFNYANELNDGSQPIIIETLFETHDLYKLPAVAVFNSDHNVTLRTTQDDEWNPETNGSRFTSTITKNFDGDSSMFSVNGGTFTVEGITLDGNNKASGNGGIFNVASESTLTIGDGATLTKGTATTGGAIYSEGTVNITAGTITGNTAADGSAVALNGPGKMNMSGGVITGNSATSADAEGGGAVYVESDDDVRITFSGAPMVYGNFNSTTRVQQNVLLRHDSNDIIRANGLTGAPGSIIGVYASKSQEAAHGVLTMPFGTYESGDQAAMNVFANDLNGKLTGKYEVREGKERKELVVWSYGEKLTFAVQKEWDDENASEEEIAGRTVYFELYQVSGGTATFNHPLIEALPEDLLVDGTLETVWPKQQIEDAKTAQNQSAPISFTRSNGFFYYDSEDDSKDGWYIILTNFTENANQVWADGPASAIFANGNHGVRFNENSNHYIDADAYLEAHAEDHAEGEYLWYNSGSYGNTGTRPWQLKNIKRGDVIKYKGIYYAVWNESVTSRPLEDNPRNDGTLYSGQNDWFSIKGAGGSSSSGAVTIQYDTQEKAEKKESDLAGYTVTPYTNSSTQSESVEIIEDGVKKTVTKQVFKIDASDVNWTKMIPNLDADSSYYVVERKVTETVTNEDGTTSVREMPLKHTASDEGIFNVIYSYNQTGDSVIIRNSTGSNGVQVGFRKISSDGSYLAGAKFALYENYQDAVNNVAANRVTVTGEEGFVEEDANKVTNIAVAYGTTSAGQTAEQGGNGNTATTTTSTDPTPTGAVKFGVPEGIYFMRETTTPSGYEANNNTYLVLAGEGNMTYADLPEEVKQYFINSEWISKSENGTALTGESLAAAVQALLDAQNNANGTPEAHAASIGTAGGEEPDTTKELPVKGYAIFQLERKETTKGGTTTTTLSIAQGSDVTNYGLMNESTRKRKVILRKTDSGFNPLPGAGFTLYNADWTRRDETTEHLAAESLSSGVFYINMLPLGRYYLEETKVPSDTYSSYSGKYFILDVTTEGVEMMSAAAEGAPASTPAKVPRVFTKEEVTALGGASKNKAILTRGGASVAGGNTTPPNSHNNNNTNPTDVTTTNYEITAPSGSYRHGQTVTAVLNKNGKQYNDSSVSWSSDNEYATVSGNQITFVNETDEDKTVTITATADNKTEAVGSVTITVKPNTTGLTVIPAQTSYRVGDVIQLMLSDGENSVSTSETNSLVPSAGNGEIQWYNNTGGITLLKSGTIKITATLNQACNDIPAGTSEDVTITVEPIQITGTVSDTVIPNQDLDVVLKNPNNETKNLSQVGYSVVSPSGITGGPWQKLKASSAGDYNVTIRFTQDDRSFGLYTGETASFNVLVTENSGSGSGSSTLDEKSKVLLGTRPDTQIINQTAANESDTWVQFADEDGNAYVGVKPSWAQDDIASVIYWNGDYYYSEQEDGTKKETTVPSSVNSWEVSWKSAFSVSHLGDSGYRNYGYGSCTWKKLELS